MYKKFKKMRFKRLTTKMSGSKIFITEYDTLTKKAIQEKQLTEIPLCRGRARRTEKRRKGIKWQGPRRDREGL